MAQQRQLADLFTHASTGFAVTDEKGCVVEANKSFAKIVDREYSEIRGANLLEWIHPEDRIRHRSMLEQLLSARIPGFVIEKRYLRPDGTIVWVRNSVTTVHDENAQPAHVLSICEDISAYKSAERALERQGQLANMGKLTASILHEINNPLEAVTNLIYLARHATQLEEATGYLKQAEKELGRVSEVTGEGLRFNRQSASPTSVSMTELLQSVLALFAGKLTEARVEVELRKEDAPHLVCFAGEMRQVFVNLISNSIEAMPGGGRTIIKVRPGTDWRTNEQGVRITIADTGKGMSAEARKHLYDAFFTTKGSEGSGLGLWVTSNIIRKHQGLIHVRSRSAAERGGTTFTLIFPYRGAEGRTPGSQAA
jgi:two-component system sporulation sensor kinase C